MSSSSDDEEMVVMISFGEEEEDEGKHRKDFVVTTKKEVRNYDEAQPSSQAVKSGKKRMSEETSTDVKAKRAKKRNSRRLFTKEDDIVLLKGMLDYKTVSPRKDGFYESVKNSISFDVTTSQFCDKIMNLKKIYMRKRGDGVKPPCFMNLHDKKCFELSKRIWGSEGLVVGESSECEKSKTKMMADSLKQGSPSSSKGKKVEEDRSEVLFHGGDVDSSSKSDWFEKLFLVESIGLDECIVKQRWSKVPMETKKEIEEDLKVLEEKEIECAVQKSNLESQNKNLLHKVTCVISKAV